VNRLAALVDLSDTDLSLWSASKNGTKEPLAEAKSRRELILEKLKLIQIYKKFPRRFFIFSFLSFYILYL